ncbi:MAG: DUF389 domain-containing protein, partial [Psychromonas sp.]
MSDSFLLFDIEKKDEISEKVLPFFAEKVLPRAWQADAPAEFAPESRVYLYVSDQQTPAIIEAAIQGGWFLSILPHEKSHYARQGFCLENNLAKAIQAAQQATPRKVDILRCNGQIVLNSVVVGDSFNLLPSAQSLNLKERLKLAWHNISKIHSTRPRKINFATANDNSFSTAAIGLVVLGHAHGTALSRNILSDTHINDGLCDAIIVAPHSVMEMLRFFITAPLRRNVALPNFLGLLKSRSFTVSNSGELNYQIDGDAYQSEQLLFATESRSLNLLVGESLPISETSPSDKEQRKINRLPVGEAIDAMVNKPLPFIKHAATEEFKELYQLLRENATTSPAFLTLMVLSTLLASIGLFASSAPVIIGAMILAPLMAPIISLSMALARQDASLLSSSTKTLMTGLFMALICAAIASFILPMEIVTPEIAARLSPSLLDLGVAVIS